MTLITIKNTISEGTRILLSELLNNALEAINRENIEDVGDVKILAMHLNAIVEELEGETPVEPQTNMPLCSLLQQMPMAWEFDWQSILNDKGLDPTGWNENMGPEAEVQPMTQPKIRKRRTA